MSGRRVSITVIQTAVAILFLALTSSFALGDKREDAARKAYEAGFTASEAKHFDDALTHYTRSYSLLPRPRTLFNIAMCELELGHGESAIGHFEEFARIATERDKAFKSLAADKLAMLKRKFYGVLIVKSQPSRAQVFIDGGAQGAGKTPLRISLAPGPHEVTVASSGKRPAVRNVQVVAGKSTAEFVRLGKATLNLVVTPKDAAVEFADQPGVRPSYVDATMEPGTYRFRISRPGFRTQVLQLKLEPDTKLERHVTLELIASGALLVQSQRAGATVSIDGQVVGLTQHSDAYEMASVRKTVEAGEHHLMIELDNHTIRRRVHTAPGELVTIVLEPSQGSGVHSKSFVWTLAGAGVASLALGAGLGVHSLKRGGSSDPMEQDAARSQALIGDILVLGGGGALLGAWALGKSSGETTRVSRTMLTQQGDDVDAK